MPHPYKPFDERRGVASLRYRQRLRAAHERRGWHRVQVSGFAHGPLHSVDLSTGEEPDPAE